MPRLCTEVSTLRSLLLVRLSSCSLPRSQRVAVPDVIARWASSYLLATTILQHDGYAMLNVTCSGPSNKQCLLQQRSMAVGNLSRHSAT